MKLRETPIRVVTETGTGNKPKAANLTATMFMEIPGLGEIEIGTITLSAAVPGATGEKVMSAIGRRLWKVEKENGS